MDDQSLSGYYREVLADIYLELVAFVSRWFYGPIPRDVVGSALGALLLEAHRMRNTSQGPYERLLGMIEFRMRMRSYSTGTIIPLGLPRLFPLPTMDSVWAFTKIYGCVTDIGQHLSMPEDSIHDIVSYLCVDELTLKDGEYDDNSRVSWDRGRQLIQLCLAFLDEEHLERNEQCHVSDLFMRKELYSAQDWYASRTMGRRARHSHG